MPMWVQLAELAAWLPLFLVGFTAGRVSKRDECQITPLPEPAPAPAQWVQPPQSANQPIDLQVIEGGNRR